MTELGELGREKALNTMLFESNKVIDISQWFMIKNIMAVCLILQIKNSNM